MKSPKWNNICAAGNNGLQWETPEAFVHLEAECFSGGYACYLSAKAPEEGFSDYDAISFSPTQKIAVPYMAIRNHSTYWSSPVWGKTLSDLPDRIQELLIETKNGFRCYLPVCTEDFRVSLKGTPGGLVVSLSSNKAGVREIKRSLVYICMEGTKPIPLMKDIAREVARRSKNKLRMRDERQVPETFNYLGWCSWDSFQVRINHQGLLKKAKEFRLKDVPVYFVILDDMWADVPPLNNVLENTTFKEMCKVMHTSSLRSFQGDPIRFPGGMSKAISDLKKSGIREVGIWFPTSGYWRGWDKNGEASQMMELFVTTEDGRLLPKPEFSESFRYFQMLFDRIKSWGGDFVKVDNQAFYFQYHNVASFGKCAETIQPAIERNAMQIFNGCIINCMGMATECLFNRSDTAVCRCSDDFIPESPEWFAKNIMQCSFNGLLQGQYYVNDWDMWWTDDSQAQKNSLCRAISGGPIYISDKLERTNETILHPLILSDGKILRPDESATPTEDCLMDNPTSKSRPFKIRNNLGKVGVIAAFNISESLEIVSGVVSPKDAENGYLKKEGKNNRPIAWYEFFTGEAGLTTYESNIPIVLKNKQELRLYTFAPFSSNGHYAVLGRVDLFMGIRAVSETENGFCPIEPGVIALVSDTNLSLKTKKGEQIVPILHKGELWLFECPAERIIVDAKPL